MFDEIRPYYDHEVNEALQIITSDSSFLKILKYLYPEWDPASFNEKVKNIRSIHEFQEHFVYEALTRILKKTSQGLFCDGFQNIDKSKSYIYLSNHRDIILDSAFLNYLLFGRGFETTEVAIGDNLLINDSVISLAKLNRNFIVHRNIPTSKLYEYSLRLSAYIHYTLKEKKLSVWVAQKEGRAKEGNDKTQPGVLKMFGIASKDNFVDTFKSLNIVPVSISYEYEPCDNLKAAEVFLKESNIPYTKTRQDDRNSMVSGVIEQKGRIHFSIGKPIDEELDDIKDIPNKNDQIKALAVIIDRHIHSNYKLWPNNFIAYDIMNKQDEFSAEYTLEDKQRFLNYIAERIKLVPGDPEKLKQIMIRMYGNPVKNKFNTNP
jgi:1-acyl-sn-glycerol-3-phosphate acyltransferase